ncbi:hypothetical protein NPIL_45641, partial [Nephila pilipes]
TTSPLILGLTPCDLKRLKSLFEEKKVQADYRRIIL